MRAHLALLSCLSCLSCLNLLSWPIRQVTAAEPVAIGSRLELFVDDLLVERLAGGAELKLQRPEPREVVLVTDQPWEGNTCAYYSIFRDGNRLRMYYRGSHWDEVARRATHEEVTCYAESRDGIHWTKPALGLVDFQGSTQNNIVWKGLGAHCMAVFKDDNPACPAEARYKAISAGSGPAKKGLYIFQSPDGLRWQLASEEPVITNGAFDSQNLAFWDPHAGCYREYHRTFVRGVRAIMTGTSSDYRHWSEPKLLDYGDAPDEHLYTNAVRNYARAPHILLGFPTRFLPKEDERVEPVFMASRDGYHFQRWPTAVIPEDAPQDRGGNRSNYMTWGIVELPEHPHELSVYATEAYYTGPDSRVRRFVYRADGFVAVQAGAETGSLVTKPLTFTGNRLRINGAADNDGQIRVELQTPDGQTVSGFAAADCQPFRGDTIDAEIRWSSDIGRLAGQPVRIRFELQRARLFSFQFQ